ncbi:EthD domain-containing protein [Denitratisoma oestradiolicum]|uniref:Ethyl tert-butyl ether degradation protein EthD n=1 Tax=Denitratisoma oestradiolicum TaxID=311182 RepID=A0A6S6XPH7_9PROT|nr:EthD domain-containing protein [Denitratisoma oestradiolicum]TWO81106.1 hypothetical protein CBW56_05720 [Denitratisoma oestradiolicum]CAB1367786.1 Ethyl tert-butyl ether degradation protein EthD [Denitratisoma oestradiolicum]
MFKAIGLLKRKSGISRQDFISYYENQHAPLVLRLMPEVLDYRRNFLPQEESDLLGYDSLTEFWFADRAAYEAGLARFEDPHVFAELAADEENFLDRSRTRMFPVDERCSKTLLNDC